MSEKQTVPLPGTAIENNINFQESLPNICRPEAVNTAGDTYGGKLSMQRPTSHTIYGLPFQFNTAQNPEHHVKFPPNLTVETNLSLYPVSLEETLTNSLFFQSRARELVGNHEFEGEEASFKHCRAEFFNGSEGRPSEFNSSLYSVPDIFYKGNSRQTRELSLYSNTDKIKSEATTSIGEKSSPRMTRTSGKVKNSRKAKSVKIERAHKHGDTRDFHNDMEKQRRTNMKTRFQNLRLTVPELWDNEKASKIVILQKAFQYISVLEKESTELEKRKRAERLRNIELLDKLQTITSGKC